MKLEDSYLQQGQRKRMVSQLAEMGIRNEQVLKAMNKVPRHLFLQRESALYGLAYEIRGIRIGSGQTISSPYTVAYQTEQLDVKAGDKVLEIGTGSGYQAAVLAAMGVEVYTMERIQALYMQTRPLLESLQYDNIYMFLGDGFEGLPDMAPFQGILITAAAPEVPDSLIEQLDTGAKLVFPLGLETSDMMRVTRIGQNNYQREVLDKFAFVPMLKGIRED